MLATLGAYAQLVLDNAPPSIDWQRINTPHFNIIFPSGFDSSAQRVANTLERLYYPASRTLGAYPRRTSVLLQTPSAQSNALVSLFPRRMELNTLPSQDYQLIGTNDWLDLTVVHEFRHVVQYQLANRGVNRLVYYAMGNPGLATLAHASVPAWFWEGDAVAAETAFTPSGRGRMPGFGLLFRTNLLEGRKFGYHKQLLGSYRHNTPDHYVLGFHMVSWLRKKHSPGERKNPWDEDIWESIARRTWNFPIMPFAFSSAIKGKSGMTVTRLYRTMAKDLKEQWEEEKAKEQISAYENVTPRTNRTYTDYLYPQPQPDGKVLAMRKGLSHIEEFVLLDPDEKGRAHKVKTPGVVNPTGMLSAEDGLLAWNEIAFHPRWRAKSYSVIRLLDLRTGTENKFFGRNTRFSGTALSADRKRLVTVESDEQYRHSVVVFSVLTGTIMRTFSNPANYFYSMPRFTPSGDVVALKTTKTGKTVAILDMATGSERDLLPPSHENIGSPFMTNEWLLFSSPVSGIDNIFAIDLKSGKRYQVTSSRYGAYSPAASTDGKFIYYNEQGRDGMDVVRVPFDPGQWPLYRQKPIAVDLHSHLAAAEGDTTVVNAPVQLQYPQQNYSRFSGLINPYAWGAVVTEDRTKVEAAVTSRDILGTTQISAGYVYDLNEKTGLWKGMVSFQGWFPVFDLSFSSGNRKINGSDIGRTEGDTTLLWKEQTATAGIRIPLLTTRSRFHSALQIGSEGGLTLLTDYPFPGLRDVESISFVHSSILGYSLLKRSKRDIYSKWGISYQADYYRTLSTSDIGGEQLSFLSYVYLPGFFRHHSINGYAGVQYADLEDRAAAIFDDYAFRNQLPEPRGTVMPRFRYTSVASINYTFPLFYPDIALGPFINFQRVRLNGFYDYAQDAIWESAQRTYSSVGGEIRLDINIFRFVPQADIGLRISHDLSNQVRTYELLIGAFRF